MNTAIVSPASSEILPASPIATFSPAQREPGGLGRPTELTERMLDRLCSIIRETGASDSGAAARAGLHPSTISRWKRDCLEFAIVLRSAREDYRQAQLEVIQREAQAGKATNWRAAAWLLERIFPEDYSPRAAERAKFQERFEAVCASEVEVEGETIGRSDNQTIGGASHRGEALQNVQNSATPTTPVLGDGALPGLDDSNPAPCGGARVLENGTARAGLMPMEDQVSQLNVPSAAHDGSRMVHHSGKPVAKCA